MHAIIFVSGLLMAATSSKTYDFTPGEYLNTKGDCGDIDLQLSQTTKGDVLELNGRIYFARINAGRISEGTPKSCQVTTDTRATSRLITNVTIEKCPGKKGTKRVEELKQVSEKELQYTWKDSVTGTSATFKSGECWFRKKPSGE